MQACRLIDSHVHLDLVMRYHPAGPAWWREHGCGVVSWSFSGRISSLEDLEQYFVYQRQAVERANKEDGLFACFLAGIHPRDIPEDMDLQRILPMLEPLTGQRLCLGIGEIGLETGSLREQQVLRAQLQAGREILPPDKKIGIHTPRTNKLSITRQLLELLDDFEDLRPRIVIDHCSGETLPLVLEKGFMAGVTLSPVKTSLETLQDMVAAYPAAISRIICNTDSGSEFFKDLVQADNSRVFSSSVSQKLFRVNAMDFFNLDRFIQDAG